MSRWLMYNDDVEVASFVVRNAIIVDFTPSRPALLPMQLLRASAEGFTAWLRERAIDLNNLHHRELMHRLLGSRDKTTLALRTHMFSISDTFTCFEEGEFIPRQALCDPDEQNAASDFILISSDTSLRRLSGATPNASTDGSFTKTWRYEGDAWWLYKLQSTAATRAEVAISQTLRDCGWAAAEYAYAGRYRKRVRSKSFLQPGEFFEPYDSFRFRFDDPSDDDGAILGNFASLGPDFERDWRRILLCDALFFNTDRHMRNFGVIRDSHTGKVLRLAPNFDNNQAYDANPGGYSPQMLRVYMAGATEADRENLKALCAALENRKGLEKALNAGRQYIS